MAGLTPKSTPLKGPGGYTTNTPTKSGSAGQLKPMGGGKPMRVQSQSVSPFSGGKRGGDDSITHRYLKNVKRTVVSS